MQEQQRLRQQLLARKRDLQMREQKVSADMRRAQQPLESDFAEQAVQRENDEVIDALDVSIHAELAQIEHTLAQLDAGAYGICERCGKPIAQTRLAAQPLAALCIACAESVEATQ